MASWGRDTQWRQGQLIPQSAFNSIGLDVGNDQQLKYGVVISHDCDLSQSAEYEPNVEILLGSKVDRPDGNLTYAKNPRRLHIPYNIDGDRITIELYANNKVLLSKGGLSDKSPIGGGVLDTNGKSVLQRWLAARYRRSAFPDEFNQRMLETGVTGKLKGVLKTCGQDIVAIFFDVDAGELLQRSKPEEPFELIIYLLYSTGHAPQEALAGAKELKVKIEKIFHDRCREGPDNKWFNIELVDCMPISDKALTYAQSIEFLKWSADHISLKEEPQGIMLME